MFLPFIAHSALSAKPSVLLVDQVSTVSNYESLSKQLMDGLQAGRIDEVENSFDSTMQSAFPADKVQAVWKQITLQLGGFKGIDSSQVKSAPPYQIVSAVCGFESGKLDATISFDSTNHIAGLYFKPHQDDPAATPLPFGLTEKSVVVGAGGKWPLNATLTLPSGPGPFPAVVLVHGSGPNDRDETIGPNKPFRDIAWGLAKRGIAVLRYEKRTKQYAGQPIASTNSFTVNDETVDDAVLAVALLKSEARISKKQVYVLGHSLGGMMIPRIALRTPGAAGYVILAGVSEPLQGLMLEQYQARLQGQNSAGAMGLLLSVEKAVAVINSPSLSLATPASDLLGLPASYWLDLRGYRPAVVAKSIRKPLLIMQGEADIQVPMGDFEEWKSELGQRSSVEYKLYPGLSHLFMANQLTVEAYAAPNHVNGQVIEDIADWIKGHS